MRNAYLSTLLLSIWAGAGPLLGAGASAWWANSNRVADRTWQAERDAEAFKQSELATAKKAAVHAKRAGLHWRRETFLDFFRRSYDFAWLGQSPNAAELRETYRENFAKAFATLLILDGESIGAKAQAVWNAVITCVTSSPNVTEQQFLTLRTARDDFAAKARSIISTTFREHTLRLDTDAQVAPVIGST